MEFRLTDRQCRAVRRFIYRTLHNKGIEAEVIATSRSVVVVPLLEWSEKSDRGEDAIMHACLCVARIAVSRAFNAPTVGHYDGYMRAFAHIDGVSYASFSIDVCTSVLRTGECDCDY